MNNRNNALILAAILAVTFFSTVARAQVVTSDALKAIAYNGKVAIRVKDASTLNSFFVTDAGSKVSLDLYFTPDDPRNGMHDAGIVLQSGGSYYLSFSDVLYNVGDSLSFGAKETLGDNSVREYIFLQGDYYAPSNPPSTDFPCPSQIYLDQQGRLIFRFNYSVFIVGSSNLPPTVTLYFGPGNPANGTYNIAPTTALNNGFYLLDVNFNVDGPLPPINILVINGHVCQFKGTAGGDAVSDCSLLGSYDGNSKCTAILESCAGDLLELLGENENTLTCNQWIADKDCSSSIKIKRSGKVAIGTNKFSSSSLTVKNGIITDKVKVTNTGWADYVFETGYRLMPLEEVDLYIQQNHHLPDTPSGKEIEDAGNFELGEVTVNHQVKIEEIFLHLIDLNQEVDGMEALLDILQIRQKIQVK